MRARLLAVAVGTAVVVAATYLLAPSGPEPRRAGPAAPALGGYEGRTDGHEVNRLIAAYEAQVHDHPNVAAFDLLGRLYLARGRLTGDLAAYEQASAAARRSLAQAPGNLDAMEVLARTSVALHDFVEARRVAAEVLGRDPGRLEMLAVIGDAGVELGDYEAAGIALDDLAARVPRSPTVTARQARLAVVHGDLERAERLAARAEDEARAAGADGVALAYFPALRGALAFDGGRYDRAAAHYARALAVAPGDRVALAGLARARAAQGRPRDAITLYERAVAQVPEPAALAALGDLYALAGRHEDARRAHGTVEVIGRLAADGRRPYNRGLVRYWADHGLRPTAAVAMARRELAVRHDVHGHDTLAWALLNAGRARAADAQARRALALGTPDPVIRYHAGMAAAAVGDRGRAMRLLRAALAASPRFDQLQAPRARAELRRLEAGS